MNMATYLMLFDNGSEMYLNEEEKTTMVFHIGGQQGYSVEEIQPIEITKKLKLGNIAFETLVGIVNAKSLNDHSDGEYVDDMDGNSTGFEPDLYAELNDIFS